MKRLSDTKFISVLGNVQQVIVLVLITIIPILVVIQVILRYVLQMPLMGIEEIMLFPTIWLYMLGGSVASKEQNHIEAGILVLYIKKEKSLALFKLVRIFIATLVSCWLTFWAFKYFMYSLRVWKLSSLLYLPLFFGESAMFIGLLLMTLFTIVELTERYSTYSELRNDSAARRS